MSFNEGKIREAFPVISNALHDFEISTSTYYIDDNWQSWSDACLKIQSALDYPKLAPVSISKKEYDGCLTTAQETQIIIQKNNYLISLLISIYMFNGIYKFVIQESNWENESLKKFKPPLEIIIHRGMIKTCSLYLSLQYDVMNLKLIEYKIYRQANALLEILESVMIDASTLFKKDTIKASNNLVHIVETNERIFNVDQRWKHRGGDIDEIKRLTQRQLDVIERHREAFPDVFI